MTPIYHSTHAPDSGRGKLLYDLLIFALIVIDLALMGIDKMLMHPWALDIVTRLQLSETLLHYRASTHFMVAKIGGWFTLFLVGEFVARWVRAVRHKTYYRWFFFPFVHWYEALGCLPSLRALRLLRAISIAKKLDRLGIKIIPKGLKRTLSDYYNLAIEELSDLVILTAIKNLQKENPARIIRHTLTKHQDDIRILLQKMLNSQLKPALAHAFANDLGEDVGQVVAKSLMAHDDLSRYLRLIPLAGNKIANEIHHIGQKVGIDITNHLSQYIHSQCQVLIEQSTHNIRLDDPQLLALSEKIIQDALDEFAIQIRAQQQEHRRYLNLASTEQL